MIERKVKEKQVKQDRFTTCFKTCGTNSWFFPKGFKITKRGTLSGKTETR